MREKIVIAMPGTIDMPQSGALKTIAETPAVRTLLAEIDLAGAEFGVPPLTAYLTSPSARLDEVTPEVHYLALMAVSLSVFEDFVASGGEPYAIFGQSIGELWALVAGGGLDAADAARLACVRSQALSRHGWPGAMLAVGASSAAVVREFGASVVDSVLGSHLPTLLSTFKMLPVRATTPCPGSRGEEVFRTCRWMACRPPAAPGVSARTSRTPAGLDERFGRAACLADRYRTHWPLTRPRCPLVLMVFRECR
ncbi:acyltransferase domain-containing protein [Streptodolium elevatio]|uniref:Acyltransferase domain-containing protein n=1 Tax=Streptodolium elevatio TaxID=3157996 RepID=A0ABV3DAZ7_9ACTN